MKKDLPAAEKKREISVKKSSVEEKLKNAPDEVIARAIHDTITKQHKGNI